MPKYKPGQFIRVCVPGRYRVNKVSELEHPCTTCDIRRDCCFYCLQGASPFGIPCSAALGPYTNVKKVK